MSNVINREVLWLEVRPVYSPKLDVSAIQVVKSVRSINQFVKYRAFLYPSLVPFQEEPPSSAGIEFPLPEVSVSSGMRAVLVAVEDTLLESPLSSVEPSSSEAVIWPDVETTLVVMDCVPLEDSSCSFVLWRPEAVAWSGA